MVWSFSSKIFAAEQIPDASRCSASYCRAELVARESARSLSVSACSVVSASVGFSGDYFPDVTSLTGLCSSFVFKQAPPSSFIVMTGDGLSERVFRPDIELRAESDPMPVFGMDGWRTCTLASADICVEWRSYCQRHPNGLNTCAHWFPWFLDSRGQGARWLMGKGRKIQRW
jgi:hypothetical protein